MPAKHQQPTVLIVEDEVAIRKMIHFSLTSQGFNVIGVDKFADARRVMANSLPDIILLDWMLPDVNGIEIIKRLKRDTSTKNIPIIMLTAKAEEQNKIKGLNAGADDYIVKPFSPKELVARIHAVLRRGTLVDPGGIIQVNSVKLDTKKQLVTINDHVLKLSKTEYRLLLFFASNEGAVYSRQQLLDYVWGGEKDVTERTVDVYIRRLRAVLAQHNCDDHIQTVYGSGYCFTALK